MDLSWNHQLKPGQKPCPVVFWCFVEHELLSGRDWWTDDELRRVFPTDQYRLQTWCRTKGPDGKTLLVDDPHWIATRGSTPLHVDPKYPRYTHHLKVRVDPGISCRGLNKAGLVLHKGLFYILDTHSPHQVFCTAGDGWNVSASIDHREPLEPRPTIDRLLAFLQQGRLYEDLPEAERA